MNYSCFRPLNVPENPFSPSSSLLRECYRTLRYYFMCDKYVFMHQVNILYTVHYVTTKTIVTICQSVNCNIHDKFSGTQLAESFSSATSKSSDSHDQPSTNLKTNYVSMMPHCANESVSTCTIIINCEKYLFIIVHVCHITFCWHYLLQKL